MNQERILDIPEEVVASVAGKIIAREKPGREYAESVGTRMSLEQPTLFNFIRLKHTILKRSSSSIAAVGYMVGACVAFDVISATLTARGKICDISQDDINLYQRDLREKSHLTDQKKTDIGLVREHEVKARPLLDKIVNDSPEYALFLTETTRAFSELLIMSEVLTGALDVTMVYYYKLEAEKLENQLFPNNQ